MRFYYTLQTLDPIIVSQTTATINNHQGLDYIPGSAILGVVASALYPKMAEKADETWSLFHSGEVQFGPCYPVINDSLCLPTPASWHFEKGESAIVERKYQSDKITNHASNEFKRVDGTQYKQCRDGFVNGNGLAGEVTQGMTTKTALDRATGGVKESSLFSYSYLKENQFFSGWVECTTQEQFDQVKAELVGEKRIGRSRSAEFGRVLINEVQAPSISSPKSNETLILWCLSDCEIISEQGLPTLTPTLSDLVSNSTSTIKGELDRKHSFIRSTSVSRFNQARQGIDSEQVMIEKGSVLVFKNVSLDAEQLQELANKGIGINRQQGLGWVRVNPSWAFESGLSQELFTPIICQSSNIKSIKIKPTNSVLTRWLLEKVDVVTSNKEINEQADKHIRAILTAYREFRKYNHTLNAYSAGPSNTQWGRVREVIKNKPNNWSALLFKDHHIKESSAICKSANDPDGWGITWQHKDKGLITFSDYCLSVFTDPDVLMLTIEKLSRYDLSNFKEHEKAEKELLGVQK